MVNDTYSYSALPLLLKMQTLVKFNLVTLKNMSTVGLEFLDKEEIEKNLPILEERIKRTVPKAQERYWT